MTVHVHGAGEIDETTDANLLNCTVGPGGKAEWSVTDCVGGSPSGPYSSGWIVDLNALVSVGSTAYNRGWRFLKWVDGTASGQINCDPQGTTGDQFSPTNCRFQIAQNLYADAYFDDILANPVDSLSGTPAAGSRVNSTSASFDFNASGDPDSTFQCKLDRPGAAGSFVTCGSPVDKSEAYSGLTTNGTYTFTVRSLDPSGNIGASMARTWTVDTVAPTLTLVGGPSEGSTTNNTGANFTWGTPPADTASVQCKLDRPGTPGTFGPCTSSTSMSYSGLATDGAYAFSVRATDTTGNVGPAASRAWTIDTTPPDTSIDSGPSGDTSSNAATFAFSALEPNVSFLCKLDTGPWESCTSGKTYSSLALGSHTFSVRGSDQAGNAEPEGSAASRTWTITAPTGSGPGTGTGATPDTTKPVAVLTVSAQRLARVLKRGLAGSGSTTEPGVLVLDVLYRGKRVATAKRTAAGAGAYKLVAKFTRKGKRVLGRLRLARLTLVLRAADAAGNVAVKKKTVKLKR